MYSLINSFKRTFYLGKKRLLHIIIMLIVICLNVISNSYSQWTPVSFPANAYPYAFVESGQNLFMGTGSGVYMSTDNGTTWTSRGLSSYIVYGLAVSGSNVIAGVDFWGVFTSSDNGLTWSQSSISDLSINCLFANGTYIFAGTDAAGIKRSADNGLTWSPTALSSTSVYSLAGNNSYLFAGGASRVRKSSDNGANYVISILGGAFAGSVSSIVMNGSNVYAGTVNYSSPKGIYISNDNGTNWYQSTLNNKAILSLLLSGENILAGSYSNGVYLSTDAGNNWIQKNEGFTGVPSVDIMFETGSYIIAGTNILSESQLVYRRLKSELFPSPITPEYTIEKVTILTNDIYDLLNSGILTQGNAEMLISKLNNCVKQINLMEYEIAIDRIEQFIFGVNLLVDKMILTPEQAEPLLTQADEIIEMINFLMGEKYTKNMKIQEKIFKLKQNYPNPFNPITTINFEIPKSGYVSLKVYDNLGKEITTLVNGILQLGTHQVNFNGSSLSSGIYFYQLKVNEYVETKIMTLIK